MKKKMKVNWRKQFELIFEVDNRVKSLLVSSIQDASRLANIRCKQQPADKRNEIRRVERGSKMFRSQLSKYLQKKKEAATGLKVFNLFLLKMQISAVAFGHGHLATQIYKDHKNNHVESIKQLNCKRGGN